MSEKRRTFHAPGGTLRPVTLRSTAPGSWRTIDGDLFQYLGHAWLGEKGNRYRVEKWSAPHTDRTFTSLQAAVKDWVRRTSPREEKKTAAQLDAEIAHAIGKETR